MKWQTYTVKIDSAGTRRWYNEQDLLHREDGPALEYTSGNKYWYLNGELHREDGPAVEYTNGDKCWLLNGKQHREDGPAVEYTNGDKFWYLHNERLTEKQFNSRMHKQADPCDGKIVEIDGKKYKLSAV